jgi:hypothetical protein
VGGRTARPRPPPRHGDRPRGAAAASRSGIGDDWPIPSGELGEVATALRWFVWDAHEPVVGWQVRLAVRDGDDGLAWAFSATDEV